MKKYFFMAVAAIAALSSCSNNDEFGQTQIGNQGLVFTATMEDSEGTRAILSTGEDNKKFAEWEVGDKISINGKIYSAKEGAGATAIFKADGEDAAGDTYHAYFPASLYNGTTATLPANINETWADGKFNMPMYAQSETTSLSFKNLCAVLAIKVTSADITTLRSIKVTSDKKMNGSFTVTDNAAVVGSDGTNVVELKSSADIPLDETGTTFYIAIPAQEYNYLNIFLSADGTTYTQAMATKKASGLGTIARNTIYAIDYAKNATKLWAGNLFVADCNVGATSATDYGGYYTWGGSTDKSFSDYNTGSDPLSGNNDTATKLWGTNWRMPTQTELEELLINCDVEAVNDPSDDIKILGKKFTGKGAYASNSVFLPAAGSCDDGNVPVLGYHGNYWSSTPSSSTHAYYLGFDSGSPYVWGSSRDCGHSVRAVLAED